MDDTWNEELSDKVAEAISSGLSDDALKGARKQIDNILYEFQDFLEFRIKQDASANLSAFVVEMAERTVKAILAGDDDAMRRYLSCAEYQWNGRQFDHSLIHGSLFEPDNIALRRKLVEAHRDLISNERILDLEAQLAALITRMNKQADEIEGLREKSAGAFLMSLPSPQPNTSFTGSIAGDLARIAILITAAVLLYTALGACPPRVAVAIAALVVALGLAIAVPLTIFKMDRRP